MPTIETQERLKILREHLLKQYPEGVFENTTNLFNELLEVSQSVHYVDLLEREGFLKKIRKAKLVNGKWEHTQYEIIPIINKIKDMKENNVSEINDKIETKITINVNDYEETNFNGLKIRLYKTKYGYVIPITDICNALKVSKQAVRQLINKNIRLFENWVVNVTFTTSSSGLNTCLTRDGVIGLIMKIGYNRLPEEKQQLILDFQKWAITTLGKLITDGKVTLTDIEQAQIQDNIKQTLEITDEDMDRLFNDLESKVNELVDTAKDKVNNIHKTMVEDRNIYEAKIGSMRNQIYGLVAKTVALADKRREEI
jgi:hypothetical protein